MEKISKVDSLLANKLPTVATTSGHVTSIKVSWGCRWYCGEQWLLSTKAHFYQYKVLKECPNF